MCKVTLFEGLFPNPGLWVFQWVSGEYEDTYLRHNEIEIKQKLKSISYPAISYISNCFLNDHTDMSKAIFKPVKVIFYITQKRQQMECHAML